MKYGPIDPGDGSHEELPKGARDLRRASRRKITATGSVRVGGRGYRVALTNLSDQGCQFWIPRMAGIPLRSTVSLYIEKLGPFKATVRWSRDGWIGVQFDMPVYQPILRHIHQHLDNSD